MVESHSISGRHAKNERIAALDPPRAEPRTSGDRKTRGVPHAPGGRMQQIIDRGLTEEQRMMRQTIRAFVDRDVIPFIRKNWQLEWDMKPENRPSVELLEGAHKIGVRTLGVPGGFGGTPVDPKTEVQTFAMIAEEIARGDSGLADKLVQIWKISMLLRNIAPRHLQERWF